MKRFAYKTPFGSAHIAALAGVSLRQLQWWDEKRVARPLHIGHKRIYSDDVAALVIVLSELRRKGFSLQQCRRLRDKIAKLLNLARSRNENVYLITDGKSAALATDLEDLEKWPHPVVCVYLTATLKMLEGQTGTTQ